MASGDRLLVPVADSSTIRQTVEYAVEAALDEADADVRFVYVYPAEVRDRETGGELDGDVTVPGSDLLDRVSVWAGEDAGDREDELRVETAVLGTDEYLFSPEDVAAALADDAARHDTGRVILDPEYDPGVGTPLLRPLVHELTAYGSLQVEEAPVQRRTRRAPLLARTSALQVGALFGISFVFYQVLAGAFVLLDLVTGAISATIVAVGLSRITLTRDPSLETVARILRMAAYTPYLLYEILKANVQVADRSSDDADPARRLGRPPRDDAGEQHHPHAGDAERPGRRAVADRPHAHAGCTGGPVRRRPRTRRALRLLRPPGDGDRFTPRARRDRTPPATRRRRGISRYRRTGRRRSER